MSKAVRFKHTENILAARPMRATGTYAQDFGGRGSVPIPPMMYSGPFYRITYLIKEEIRKYKWIEGEKGRPLSWEQARAE